VGGVFEVLVIVAIAVFVIGGLMSMLGPGSAYEQIGRGGMSIEEDSHELQDPAQSAAEREREIRQMLEARSERRVRQGQEPLNIETELAKLDDPAANTQERPGAYDPGLVEEARQLIQARNQRRERAGLDALDVEAEVRRTLKELGA
jgi:hypothetical protein